VVGVLVVGVLTTVVGLGVFPICRTV